MMLTKKKKMISNDRISSYNFNYTKADDLDLYVSSSDSDDEEIRVLMERKKHLMNEKERLRNARNKRQEQREKKKSALKAEVHYLENEVNKMNVKHACE